MLKEVITRMNQTASCALCIPSHTADCLARRMKHGRCRIGKWRQPHGIIATKIKYNLIAKGLLDTEMVATPSSDDSKGRQTCVCGEAHSPPFKHSLNWALFVGGCCVQAAVRENGAHTRETADEWRQHGRGGMRTTMPHCTAWIVCILPAFTHLLQTQWLKEDMYV
ncbi:hypothetical protein GQ54DRAFT_297035 [Martensiomyces pterosporus]|nr:hypothetical protein GQ54DRAFT_297035 [Martensiomyces pterosporus]